jgi:hypothetical protein
MHPPLSLALPLAGLLDVLRASPQPAMLLLRIDSDTEPGLKFWVLLRTKEAVRDADWLPALLWPEQQHPQQQ